MILLKILIAAHSERIGKNDLVSKGNCLFVLYVKEQSSAYNFGIYLLL